MNVDASRYIVGLTGGVASGKTAASDEFGRLGAFVVDADVVSRDVTAPSGRATAQVQASFPDCLRDGAIDRAALRQRVFADPDSRRQLEAILHPIIRDEMLQRMASEAASTAPYIVLAVPLLFESNAYLALTAATITVDVPPSVQLERLRLLRGIDDATARAIVSAQMKRDDRLLRTQFVLPNDRSIERLHERVRVLHSVICANARAFNPTHEHAGVTA